MDVGNWLRNLGLEQYEQAFRDNHIGADVLPELTAEDLVGLGVTSIGHRRKLSIAIAALRAGALPSEAESSPVESAWGTIPVARPPEAERRQLTVMFADLVGSTALSGRLDPEEMRDVIAAYQGCCAEVIGHYDGYVAKFMGDGVLAYFGWPTAHEEDAERAVRAGLELTAAVTALKPHGNLGLAARVGIATGQVVVGDLVGAGAAQEQAVVGETPNLAARIQGLAEPGTVAIAPSTRKLIGTAFECQDLGQRTLAGVSKPMRVWRVLRPSPTASRFDAMRSAALTPLIGREEELAILTRCWGLARQGKGQIVLLTGEPGIGKSRLVQVLLERIAAEPHTHLGYQCSPFHVHSAFHPIAAQFQSAAQFSAEDRPEQKIEKLRSLMAQAGEVAADEVVAMAALLALPAGERLAEIEPDPEQRKARIFATLLRQLEGLTAQRPVVGVFEDVHWSDPSTIGLLDQLVGSIPSQQILLLVTCRPEFVSPWTGLGHSTLIAPSRMSASATAELVVSVAAGMRLSKEVVRQIVHKTDGIPLFVEELTLAIIETGILDSVDDACAPEMAPALAIPATLHNSLMARLDRLAEGREVAQIGATIGRSFDYKLLSAMAGRGEETLQAALAQLEQADLLVRHGKPPDSTYSFKHALVQDAAYGSLLRTTRQEYHRRIATALEGLSATVDPQLLAHHYAEGGMPEPAIRYLGLAGARAVETSAYAEAVSTLAKALELLGRLPESLERAREEITLRLALGGAQVQSLGPTAAEVEGTYRRARELCEQFGTPKERFTALWGLWFFHYMRGDVHRMQEFGGELLPLAQELGDSALLLEAHHVQWAGLSLVGDPRKALAHTEDGIALYDRATHHVLTFVYGGHDPGLCARNLNAVSLCLLGYPEQAHRRCEVALNLARELGHPYTLMEGLFCAMLVDLLVRDPAAIEQHVAVLEELVGSGKLPRDASGLIDGFGGWAVAELRSCEEGLDLLRQGCATWQSFFGAWCFPLDASMAAILGATAHADEGLQLVDQALHAAEQGGAHWWEAELRRVRAGLYRITNSQQSHDVETELDRAIAVARVRGARWFELRAGNDLAHLLAERGERQKAYELLAPIDGWFTEGFETPDLKEAKALLEALI